MNIERLLEWELAGENEGQGENPAPYQFVDHRSRMTWPESKPVSLVGSQRTNRPSYVHGPKWSWLQPNVSKETEGATFWKVHKLPPPDVRKWSGLQVAGCKRKVYYEHSFNEFTLNIFELLIMRFRYVPLWWILSKMKHANPLEEPNTVTARSKAWTIFARSNTGIVGSNPTRGIYVCVHLFCVCVVLCAGSDLVTGWSPVQRVLPNVYRLRDWKSGQGPQGL
jgi:hypothetical protein